MKPPGIFGFAVSGAVLVALSLCVSACSEKSASFNAGTTDPHLLTNGTVEVTARLVEIPEGAIFQLALYDYATVLKYQVIKVHRGNVEGDTIYVGHYDPWRPRPQAADQHAPRIGGNLRRFQAGQVHHLALEVPIEDHFLGGIVNKYFGRMTNAIYWAVWTNRE